MQFQLSTLENHFVQAVSGRCREIYALVNNAGIGTAGPLEWMSRDVSRDVMNVNFLGHVAVTKVRNVTVWFAKFTI